ncbi:MAG: carboxypeptidase-like regulatory domain-containing protein [Salibacteraceae bacterium]
MPTRISLFIACFILALGIFAPLGTSAQTGQLVNGYVVNAQTKQVVPYATVVLSITGKGSATDFSGYFEIWVDSLPSSDTLWVSSVGFLPKKFPLTSNYQALKTFELQPSTQQLREVTVAAKAESADEIIAKAIKRKEDLLPNKPRLLETLYREIVKNEGRYVGMTEAEGILFLGGFQKSNLRDGLPELTQDVAQWKHLRRTDYAITDDLRPQQARRLSVNRLLMLKEQYMYNGPLSKAGSKTFQYRIDRVLYEGNLPVYVLQFAPIDTNQKYPSGSIQVRSEDYGVVSLEVINDIDPLLPKEKSESQIQFVTTKFQMRFLKLEEFYHPHHIRLEAAYSVEYPNSEAPSKRVEEFLELVGGKFTNQKAPALNTNQRTVMYHEMVNPVIRYDHNYWVQKRVAYEMAFGTVVTELSQGESMDIQFLFHNGKRIYPLPKGYQSYEELMQDKNAIFNWMNTSN